MEQRLIDAAMDELHRQPDGIPIRAAVETAIRAALSAGEAQQVTCPHCGPADVELLRLCHNSECIAYAREESIYKGWESAALTPPRRMVADHVAEGGKKLTSGLLDGDEGFSLRVPLDLEAIERECYEGTPPTFSESLAMVSRIRELELLAAGMAADSAGEAEPVAWLSPEPYLFYVTDRKAAERHGYTHAVHDSAPAPTASPAAPTGAEADLKAERDAWKAYAEHQEHCAICGEAVSDCDTGSALRDTAMSTSKEGA